MAEPRLVAGVDGCPAGWIVVLWRGPGSAASHTLYPTFTEVLASAAEIIAVDMPIGLPERAGRDVDREVRPLLGRRSSSVFTVPARAAVEAEDYREACRINLSHSDPPRKIAKQCYQLFKKMREIDALMSPGLQNRVFEAHPEVGFRAMNGRALDFAKKTKEGAALRRRLLRKAGFPVDRLPPLSYRRSEAAPDDLLDACACAWIARRIRDGEHRRYPALPSHDARGLRMEINA